jgi:signal transduction histidine kinase
MSDIPLRFSTDMLRRLGEELNPLPDQGLLELVKNAYDADAHTCRITLEATDQPGGAVTVEDDGDGMDDQAIANGWLVLGRSPKSTPTTTRLGRTPAGSKGLGRLAALRMGTRAQLATRPQTSPTHEYSLTIDWALYDEVSTVEEVPLRIERHSRPRGASNGTTISLSPLKHRIGRHEIRRLARSLVLLADPFADNPTGFNPTLAAPEFRDLESLVRNKYFEEADFHLVATLDPEGRSSALLTDWRGLELFKGNHEDLRPRDKKPYSCPPATFDLWVFLLTGSSFSARKVPMSDVRTWLREFGGVHLYENGLRVLPYGNPGNDWLEINLRRAQSPEERPSTNTSIGKLAVTNIHGALVQKTDRTGFIESDEFNDLRSFAQDALEWMANRRMELAIKRRTSERTTAPKKTTRSRQQLSEALQTVSPVQRAKFEQALEAFETNTQREITELRKEVQLYRTLSTAGITTATFAHESSGNPIKVISQSVDAIERRARQHMNELFEKTLSRPIQAIRSAVKSIEVPGQVALSLLEYDKRRAGRVDVHTALEKTIELFSPFLEARKVAIVKDLYPGNPYLRATYAALESILTNLLNNSVAAFERAGTLDRIIKVTTLSSGGLLTISVDDSGPGIQGISIRDIWLPGRTTQPNGTGLGLAIVHDAVADIGGSVEAIASGPLGGAEIRITIPILGG